MRRYGATIRIKPEMVSEYIRVHTKTWPAVLEQIARSNIRNYTIFFRAPENLLFAYYEYVGTNHDADMAAMAEDPITQKWWAICKPMHDPFQTRAEGEWWAPMQEVFHTPGCADD